METLKHLTTSQWKKIFNLSLVLIHFLSCWCVIFVGSGKTEIMVLNFQAFDKGLKIMDAPYYLHGLRKGFEYIYIYMAYAALIVWVLFFYYSF